MIIFIEKKVDKTDSHFSSNKYKKRRILKTLLKPVVEPCIVIVSDPNLLGASLP